MRRWRRSRAEKAAADAVASGEASVEGIAVTKVDASVADGEDAASVVVADQSSVVEGSWEEE
jgi:hypothetical protein